MFDWDEDVDDLYVSRNVIHEIDRERVERIAPLPEGGSMMRTITMRWVAPLVIVAGLFGAGASVFDPGLAPAGLARASALQLSTMLFGRQIGEPPAELVAYGPEQYRNFMHGIAEFSDSELLDYASMTARDIGGHADPTTPFMLDVLLLTHREIEQRGLRRPTAALRIGELRESFRGNQAAL